MAQKNRIFNFLLISLFAEVNAISRKLVDTPKTDPVNIYEGLVMGVGVGTFVVLVTAGLGLLICFLKKSFANPNLIACGAVILPFIIFFIIYLWPKEPLDGVDKTNEDDLPTDLYFFKTMSFLIITIITALCACCSLCFIKCHFL